MSVQYIKYLEELKNYVSGITPDEHILWIEGTAKTPSIYLDSKEGVIIIIGRSIPENSNDFYKIINSCVRDDFEDTERIRVYFIIEYCNSSSMGALFYGLMKPLERYYLNGKDVQVIFFQDVDAPADYWDGRDYQHMKMPVHVFEMDDEEDDDITDDFFALFSEVSKKFN